MSAPDFIPDYLKPFVAKQDASLYTPMDHASWRFILRVSHGFFTKHAHPKYLAGLAEAGISPERIPLISEMDEKLSRFGWHAVAVSGFIPPAVFMEFQRLGILPIACEMRTIEHLAYTPAPDIVHEAAGHAPIIADPEFSAYLRAYGEIARKAIFSDQDMAVYEAVRHLSVVKEDPKSSATEITAAQARLDDTVSAITYASEATVMARMTWWTVEYGLVGSRENPKIYGAGLLSSLGESFQCLGPGVRHLPLTLECLTTAYDITKPQPQLFIANDFHHLTRILQEFSATMAYRLGGKRGLERAIEAKTVCTIVLDTGIQISGVVDSFQENEELISFVKCKGPTQLAFKDIEIEKQGPDYHREGFSTVVGKLKHHGKSVSTLSESELQQLAHEGITTLEFFSGIRVEGKVIGNIRRDAKLILLSFQDCTVTLGKEILFRPEWGTFDMACGDKVVSVFGGAADRKNYVAKTGGFKQSPMSPKTNLTDNNRRLNEYYADIRRLRETSAEVPPQLAQLVTLETALAKEYPEDWLSRLELLEIMDQQTYSDSTARSLRKRLGKSLGAIQKLSPDRDELISRGLELLKGTK